MELNRVSYVNNIPVNVNESLVLTRLAYKKTKSQIASDILEEIRKISKVALELSIPSGAYSFMNIDSTFDSSIIIDNVEIKNKNLATKLLGSLSVAILSVTLGKNIDEEISRLFKNNEYSKAVILDTVASILADSAMKSLMEHINIILNNKTLKLGSFRISPGQMDIPLELQKYFYDRLKLNMIHIEINENYMLSPQKSIISIAGVFER